MGMYFSLFPGRVFYKDPKSNLTPKLDLKIMESHL